MTSVKFVAWGLIVVLVLVVLELASYFVAISGPYPIVAQFYRREHVSKEEFETYLRDRDPVLGWPTAKRYGKDLELRGDRKAPANQKFGAQTACLSLYGDSYTYAEEVNDLETWGNMLAEMLDCPVRNFGISAYGVDQAVLRFITGEQDDAQITILGVYPHDLLRNMTGWYYLVGNWGNPLWFKPMFVPEGDELKQLPIPVENYDTLQRLFRNPGSVLIQDQMLPGSRHGQVWLSFPYTVALTRALWRVFDRVEFRRVFDGYRYNFWNRPSWFASAAGPSGKVLELNARIVSLFQEICISRKRKCAVLIIPDKDSIYEYNKNGTNLPKLIYDRFDSAATVWDATPFLAQRTKQRGICSYVIVPRSCYGHFNREGNKLLAEFVLGKLREHNLVWMSSFNNSSRLGAP